MLEEVEEVARFTVNTKITIVQDSTEIRETYSVTGNASLNGSGNVEFPVSPTPSGPRSGGTWFLGGWEYLMQDGTGLTEDFVLNPNVGGGPNFWTLKNVPDPTDPYDVANQNYVDNEIAAAIAANNTLVELQDTTIAAPADGELLIYSTTSNTWENRPASDAIVAAGGGTMSGDLDMGGNFILNLATPVNPGDAANMGYVDTQIANTVAMIPLVIDDLNDVTITSAGNGELLVYSGGQWRDTSPSTFIANNNIVTTAGATFLGPVSIPSGTPPANNSAAHKKYVDDQVAAALAASGDGVVNNVSFDSGTKVLTVTTTLGTNFNANLSGAAGTTTDLTHEIIVPNDAGAFPTEPLGAALENGFYENPSYPTILLDQVIREYSIALGRLATPKPRFVVVVDNAAGTIVNMDNSVDYGASQCHAPLLGGGSGPFVVGSNRLMVWVNGVKQLADAFGTVDLPATGSTGLWHGMETGLGSGNYDIRVNVDGAGLINVTVDGDDCFRMGNLVDALNIAGAAQTPGRMFSVMLFDGTLHFYSETSGTGSSIDIAAGTGNPDLIAACVGNAGTTGAFVLDYAGREVGPTTPTNYSYKEGSTSDPAFVGQECQSFTFNSPLPVGFEIEVLIEVDVFNRGV